MFARFKLFLPEISKRLPYIPCIQIIITNFIMIINKVFGDVNKTIQNYFFLFYGNALR